MVIPSTSIEPTGLVAPASVAVRSIHAAGVPVLLVEQEVAQVFRLADRNYVLSQGRIIAHGSARSLMADETLRAGYLGL